MKKFIYMLVVIVFFNLCSFGLYYLKMIDNASLVVFVGNNYDILIVNVLLAIMLIIYSWVYTRFFIHKFRYVFTSAIGLLIGVILSLIAKSLNPYEIAFIILFTSFAITFVSYSIYFEKVKAEVFK